MKRLDILLVERGLCPTREQAQAVILAGEVWSGEQRLEKAGEKYPEDVPIEIRGKALPYVSRAGLKLEHALDVFHISPAERVCLDVGASTGGFTDCLLQRGARKVFAVDVGHGQLDMKMRNHPRVVPLEKTNARHLTLSTLLERDGDAESISLAVVDVSFISLRTVLDNLVREFPKIEVWLLLFKPQFEVGRKYVGKGGIVRDEGAVQDAMRDFDQFLTDKGFAKRGGPEPSPLAGKKSGNLEYLLHYEPKPRK